LKRIITGGAGFIGCNAAARYLAQGDHVVVLDNLSRKGSEQNLAWLREQQEQLGARAGRLTLAQVDIRDAGAVSAVFDEHRDAEVVLHLAGQVAVTTSVADPRTDFEINALGTFNVLEAARRLPRLRALLTASTNKVYGGMEDVSVVVRDGRYAYASLPHGVSESQPLDCHSPYGCCYSADTDVLTRSGWKRFYELEAGDEVLTYNLQRKVAEFQRPTAYFAFPYRGKMYVQRNRRLQTCVTPNHRMLVAWDCNHQELERPRLLEARLIAGKPMAYLLAADVEGGEDCPSFVLPAVKAGKYKHALPARAIPMADWLRFLGWYLAEGHCYEDAKTGNYSVTLTTFYRKSEAVDVMRSIGLSPVVYKHHVTATSRQLYEYLRKFGKSYYKYIPQEIKNLNGKYLKILLNSLLDEDGDTHRKHGWRYATVSPRLADDVQEIALKCGMAASVKQDEEGVYRVSISTTRTAQCNQGEDRSEWVDYAGMVYCVEVPNSVIMVRQNGYAYFSGNSKGAADQYTIDYARIYGLPSVSLRQSCIYGPRQMGVEDQGWVAWFCIAAVLGKPITIYGDGMQVRDLLYVTDLLDAYDRVVERIDVAKGQAFNLGGGPENALAIAEVPRYLEQRLGRPLELRFDDWRPGDQRVFIADIRKAARELGWMPKVGAHEGVDRLLAWVQQHRDIFEKLYG
jgi:nucleoside-diphosphate-sugar epimerase